MNLNELTYQRRTAKRTAQEMLDRAITEGRTLSIAEQVQFDSLATRISELYTAITERESLRRLAQ